MYRLGRLIASRSERAAAGSLSKPRTARMRALLRYLPPRAQRSPALAAALQFCNCGEYSTTSISTYSFRVFPVRATQHERSISILESSQSSLQLYEGTSSSSLSVQRRVDDAVQQLPCAARAPQFMDQGVAEGSSY